MTAAGPSAGGGEPHYSTLAGPGSLDSPLPRGRGAMALCGLQSRLDYKHTALPHPEWGDPAIQPGQAGTGFQLWARCPRHHLGDQGHERGTLSPLPGATEVGWSHVGQHALWGSTFPLAGPRTPSEARPPLSSHPSRLFLLSSLPWPQQRHSSLAGSWRDRDPTSLWGRPEHVSEGREAPWE